ncbi:hypothetical protein J3A83DRAFT_4085377 [Scleroderma citrinum]
MISTFPDNSIPIINSTELHPLDSAVDIVELRKAICLLEGACQQLCASLAPPIKLLPM